jgi:hypothetical protein
MKWRPFPLTVVLEAIKISELRSLESAILELNPATSRERTPMQKMLDDINSICSELVVGRRFFGERWLPKLNVFHEEADVGHDIEVRSTTEPDYSLLVRDNDDPFRRYVLVITDVMKGYSVKGWAYGYEAMREEWATTRGAGGRPCWMYRGELRPWSTLTLNTPDDAKKEFEW